MFESEKKHLGSEMKLRRTKEFHVPLQYGTGPQVAVGCVGGG